MTLIVPWLADGRERSYQQPAGSLEGDTALPVDDCVGQEEWQVHLVGSQVVEQLNWDADTPFQLYACDENTIIIYQSE